MTVEKIQILKDIMKLSPKERARLADQIISSLDQPDEKIDVLWRKEVENRVKAYQEGKIKTVTLKEAMAKYQK
jgi:putative addiction module component (TIGR02574 family)